MNKSRAIATLTLNLGATSGQSMMPGGMPTPYGQAKKQAPLMVTEMVMLVDSVTGETTDAMPTTTPWVAADFTPEHLVAINALLKPIGMVLGKL